MARKGKSSKRKELVGVYTGGIQVGWSNVNQAFLILRNGKLVRVINHASEVEQFLLDEGVTKLVYDAKL